MGKYALSTIRQEHYKGAASELKAASYYLSQGYQVYFPAVQQSHVDFVIERDGKFKRVQAKTATWTKSGPRGYLQARTRLTNKYQDIAPSDLYDILAVVYGDAIWEIPARLIDSSNLCLARTSKSTKPLRWEKFKRTLQ